MGICNQEGRTRRVWVLTPELAEDPPDALDSVPRADRLVRRGGGGGGRGGFWGGAGGVGGGGRADRHEFGAGTGVVDAADGPPAGDAGRGDPGPERPRFGARGGAAQLG